MWPRSRRTIHHPIKSVILDIIDAYHVAAFDGSFLESLEPVIIVSGFP